MTTKADQFNEIQAILDRTGYDGSPESINVETLILELESLFKAYEALEQRFMKFRFESLSPAQQATLQLLRAASHHLDFIQWFTKIDIHEVDELMGLNYIARSKFFAATYAIAYLGHVVLEAAFEVAIPRHVYRDNAGFELTTELENNVTISHHHPTYVIVKGQLERRGYGAWHIRRAALPSFAKPYYVGEPSQEEQTELALRAIRTGLYEKIEQKAQVHE